MSAALTRTRGFNETTTEVATMVGEQLNRGLRDVEGLERHRVARERIRGRLTAAVDVRVLPTEPYGVGFAVLPEVRPEV